MPFSLSRALEAALTAYSGVQEGKQKARARQIQMQEMTREEARKAAEQAALEAWRRQRLDLQRDRLAWEQSNTEYPVTLTPEQATTYSQAYGIKPVQVAPGTPPGDTSELHLGLGPSRGTPATYGYPSPPFPMKAGDIATFYKNIASANAPPKVPAQVQTYEYLKNLSPPDLDKIFPIKPYQRMMLAEREVARQINSGKLDLAKANSLFRAYTSVGKAFDRLTTDTAQYGPQQGYELSGQIYEDALAALESSLQGTLSVVPPVAPTTPSLPGPGKEGLPTLPRPSWAPSMSFGGIPGGLQGRKVAISERREARIRAGKGGGGAQEGAGKGGGGRGKAPTAADYKAIGAKRHLYEIATPAELKALGLRAEGILESKITVEEALLKAGKQSTIRTILAIASQVDRDHPGIGKIIPGKVEAKAAVGGKSADTGVRFQHYLDLVKTKGPDWFVRTNLKMSVELVAQVLAAAGISNEYGAELLTRYRNK